MGEVYPPETDELRALREQLRRDEEALAAIEAALAQIPVSVRNEVDQVAQRPQKYGFREFVAYMRSWMTTRNLFHVVNLAYWLYGYYLSKYAEVHPDMPADSTAPPWGAPDLCAPCSDASGSVVDAVFAKAERKPERRAA